MKERNLKDIISKLEAIKERLGMGSMSGMGLRGPVADPGPGWGPYLPGPVVPFPGWGRPLPGPVADPGPSYLLDKAKLAQLKIRKIDVAITELEKQIELLKLERDLLKKEYKIRK